MRSSELGEVGSNSGQVVAIVRADAKFDERANRALDDLELLTAVFGAKDPLLIG